MLHDLPIEYLRACVLKRLEQCHAEERCADWRQDANAVAFWRSEAALARNALAKLGESVA